MKNEKWFALDVAQVEKQLKTNAASGLSRKAARSRCRHESGSFLITRTKSPLRMLGELLSDFSLILLLLCAVFALFFEDFQNGITVLVISVLHLVLSFILYYHTQRTLESLQACFRPMARVIRDGKLYYVDFSRVVVGDVLLLERGDVVAADLRLVTSDSLSVRMQTDPDTYVLLDKYAGAAPRDNETDVTKLVNMLHAGSVVERGNARGIVTAVGTYTYLGAKTGGVVEPFVGEIPTSLKRMRAFCSRLGMLSLLCVLPFCLLSLIISHWNHGDVLLSSAFLTALAIAVSLMPQLVMTVYRAFFVIHLRRAMQSEAPTAVRSEGAFERMAKSEYLFVLDGAALSDGRMHFDMALTFDGEVTHYDLLTPSASALGRLTALYCMAEKRSLSIGIDETETLSDALREFCRACRVDQGALAIQYPSLTYFPGNAGHALDSVRYFERGNERWISVSLADVLQDCSEAITYGQPKPLTEEGISHLQKQRQRLMAEGKQVMIVSVLEPKSGTRCFVGMLVLRDGRDPALLKRIFSLQRMGLTPVFFIPERVNEKIPKMPPQILSLPGIATKTLQEQFHSVLHDFGKYRRYDGAAEEDVLAMIAELHRQKKRVAVLSFSDDMPRVLEMADCVVACSAIQAGFFGHMDEEIRVMETDGTESSASCLQTVKWRADVLIARPYNGLGGLGALLALRRMAVRCYHNLSSFFQYALCTHVIRLLAVALPMLLGNASLNARHVLVCSCAIDFAALILFWRRRCEVHAYESESRSFLDYVKRHRPLWIAAATAALSLILLPRLMDLLGWIGPFYFKVEFSFCAVLYLHLTVLFVLLIGRVKHPRDLLLEKGFFGVVAGILGFLILCFFVEPIGVLFDVASNPFGYAILSFVPSVLFAVVYGRLTKRREKGK